MFRTISAVLRPVLESWADAGHLVSDKAREDMAGTGCNIRLASLMQCAQMMALRGQFSTLLQARQKTHRAYLTFSLACLIPVSIGFLQHKIKNSSHHTTKIIVGALHSKLGSLCHIASVAISIALLKSGRKTYAVTSLAILSFGYLSRHQYLPLPLIRCCSRINTFVSSTGSLLCQHWVLKLFAVSRIYDQLFPTPTQIPYAQADHPSYLLTLEQFNDIVSGKVSVQVNRDHVRIESFPPFPPANTDLLIQFGDTFPWNHTVLSRELQKDARWGRSKQKADYDQASSETERQNIQIAYAKDQFKTLVNSVQNESIQTGMFVDYKVLKNYLGCVAEKLPQAVPEMQAQIMIQLAVEGGDYCDVGVCGQLAFAATMLLNTDSAVSAQDNPKKLPLKQRVLHFLQQERARIIEGFHRVLLSLNSGLHIPAGGKQDIHPMNITINLLGSDFGLLDQGARHDPCAQLSKGEKRYHHTLLQVFPEHLWEGLPKKKGKHSSIMGYTDDRILNTLYLQIGIASLPKSDIYDWAREWATAHKADGVEDRMIDGEFEDKQWVPKADGKFEEQRVFKHGFLRAMLVDMGIFTIKGR